MPRNVVSWRMKASGLICSTPVATGSSPSRIRTNRVVVSDHES